MKIHAPGYRLLIKLMPEETTSKGGIVLPDNLLDKVNQSTTFAEVIEIGPNCWHDCGGPEAWMCKPGSIIAFNKYSYKDVVYEVDESNHPIKDDNLFKIINDKDVIGVYTNG